MDLHSMLNPKKPGEDERDRAHRSASVTSQSKPALPALSTSSSTGAYPHGRSSDPYSAYAHTQSATTPTPPPSYPPHIHPRPSQPYHGSHPASPPTHVMHQPPLQSPHPQSPYSHTVHTPGGSYGQQATHYFARQQSASSQTPTSVYDYPPVPQQHPHPQHRSPMSPQAQQHSRIAPPGSNMPPQPSYPQTPLGPPPSRASVPPHVESPQNHQRTSSVNSQSSFGAAVPPPPVLHHPLNDSHEPRAHRAPLARYDSSSTNGLSVDRERSISVSPRTVVTKIPDSRRESVAHDTHPRQFFRSERKSTDSTPPNSSALSGQPPAMQPSQPTSDSSLSRHSTQPGAQSRPESSQSGKSASHEPAAAPAPAAAPVAAAAAAAAAPVQGTKRVREAASHESMPPAKRVKKIKPPPIWAQRAKGKGRDRAPKPRLTNGHPPAPAPSTAAAPRNQSPEVKGGDWNSSDWEPTLTNVVPFEDLTREVCDFLLAYIVRDTSLSTGEAGAIPSSAGQMEIEARLGRIIDKKTNERLSLPTRTECVLNQGMDVAFESMMTLEQHKSFNEFLNRATQTSRTPPSKPNSKPRIPIDYKHTREIDSFYELPASELASLPHPLQVRIRQSGRAPTVRVTRDAKTNALLATIIKVPIDKIHVYNPKYAFDWRISVNAEMNWTGSVAALTPAAETKTKELKADRRKDRMSYAHQHFVVDLTQVTSSAGGDATHELEVEVATARVRELGARALRGDSDSGFAELVKGFTDNVRVLARHAG